MTDQRIIEALTQEALDATKPKCAYPDCERPATDIATGRRYLGDDGLPLGYYCRVHAEAAQDQGIPEYTESCPNCGCMFGVN